MSRERWLFDGWELTEGTVRDWAYRGGTDATTAPVGANATVPNRDGEIWRPKAAGPGSFNLDVWLDESSRADVEAAWRTLIRATRRRHRLVNVVRHMASGEIVECDAELVGTIEPTFMAQRGIRASLGFSVPRGVWRSQQIFTMQTVPGAALPQTLSLVSLEPSTEAMVDLTFQVKGAVANPVIVDTTDGVDGDSLKYSAVLLAGASITFNSDTWAVTGSGITVDQSKVYPTGRRLMTVAAARPGATPKVQLRGSATSAATQLVVTGRRSYAC